ncbi:hypothetical protein GCM10009119_38820 [Algoriphagus jejuensis]|uniref:Glycosyltransferase involved in cell wall biosynthesis n=1 Tax=Algoriphagus jejuensis TaxID=419934 RepID=A0ABN1N4Q4_9BACT
MGKRQNSKRILVGFGEVAGYFANLYDGFVALNQNVGYINNINFTFEYNYDRSINHNFLNKYIDFCKKYRNQPNSFRKFIYHLYSSLILLFVSIRYDVFILGCNSTLLGYWDYRILRFLNKKIIYISLGSDSRPPFLNGKYKDDSKNNRFDIDQVIAETRVVSEKIKFFEKYVDIFINYPQHAHFHSKSFINGMNIGFPTRKVLIPDSPKKNGKAIKILHAPSRPNAKGTHFFRNLISELRIEGISIDFIELVNKTNQEVLSEIRRVDIVLDELYSDLPLGGLGTEAAMYGVPVVVGGYYADLVQEETNSGLIAPSMYLRPDLVKDGLRKLCLDSELRRKVGKDLLSFVSNQWRIDVVAQKYLDIIDDNYDPNWLFDPKDLKYIHGWGLSTYELKSNLSSIVNHVGGLSNLCLTNKSLIEKIRSLEEHDFLYYSSSDRYESLIEND